MDYKEEGDGATKKVHNCHVDEQKKYKEEQKAKFKDELLKKKNYEISLLKQVCCWLAHLSRDVSTKNA